jgi:hypothetical protein
MKQLYGDKIGYCAMVEGVEFGQNVPPEQYLEALRKSVDIYAPGGGSYMTTFSTDSALLWDSAAELFCYSREFYDNARRAK